VLQGTADTGRGREKVEAHIGLNGTGKGRAFDMGGKAHAWAELL